MIALTVSFVGLSLFANYAAYVSWGQVLTTELKGTEFFALEVKPQVKLQDRYYYAYAAQLVAYHDPGLVNLPYDYPYRFVKRTGEVDISALNRLHYVIISKQGTDSTIFAWGQDPFAAWPQTEVGKRANLLYNNGYFQIYENRLIE